MSRDMYRRQVLRGAFGVALGLPLLESLGAKTAKAAEPVAKRFVAVYNGCGIDVERFWPRTLGPLTDASLAGSALQPLAPHASKLLVPRGIQGSPRGFEQNNPQTQNGGNDHDIGTASRLTAAGLDGVANRHYARGISVDQEMAKSINPNKRPALALGIGRDGIKDGAALGYISYLGAEKPAPRVNNPWQAFKEMMGTGAPAQSGGVADLVLKRRQSVLDAVKVQLDRVKSSPKVSRADREKLDMHFTAIREVETNVASQGALTACDLSRDKLAQIQALQNAEAAFLTQDSNFPTIGKLQMDVLALGLACGYTNVATLMWGAGASGPVFSWLGQTEQHHSISHRAIDFKEGTLPNATLLLHEIDKWYASQFKYLLDRLSEYKEADGKTLLDNSVVVWLNELSNGVIHDFRDLPFVIAGSGGGYLKQGEYIAVTKNPIASGPDNTTPGDDAPANKLLTTFLNAVGATNNGARYTKFGQHGPAGEFDQLKR